MSMAANDLVSLDASTLEPATDLLGAAFAADPLMDFLFYGGAAKDRGRRSLMRFACEVRLHLDWPLLGVYRDGALAGVAGLTMPEPKDWPAGLDAAYRRLGEAVGAEAIGRLERYSAAVDAAMPPEPHYFLGVVGVHPRAQGQGLGGRLLAEVGRRSRAHSRSTGVALDTTKPANVAFYEHHGYQLLRQQRVDDRLDVWCMFRPDDED